MSNENNGLKTKEWGPSAWVFLHSVAYGYPVKIDMDNSDHIQRKEFTKLLFKSLGYTLPCVYCRESYRKFYNENNIENYLDTRRGLTTWIYNVHNMVNKKLNITNYPTLEEVDKKYNSLRAGNKDMREDFKVKDIFKNAFNPFKIFDGFKDTLQWIAIIIVLIIIVLIVK